MDREGTKNGRADEIPDRIAADSGFGENRNAPTLPNLLAVVDYLTGRGWSKSCLGPLRLTPFVWALLWRTLNQLRGAKAWM